MANTITVPTMKMYPNVSISNLLGNCNRRHKTTDGEDRSSNKRRYVETITYP